MIIVKLHEIVESVRISTSGGLKITFYMNAGYERLYVRWEPCFLTLDLKLEGKNAAKDCIELFKHNPQDNLHCCITVNET